MHLVALFLQSGPDQQTIRHILITAMTILPMIIIVGLAIVILPFWFICKKAGLSPWLSLLNIIPAGNLVLIYLLAFMDWNVVPAPAPTWPLQPPNPPQP